MTQRSPVTSLATPVFAIALAAALSACGHGPKSQAPATKQAPVEQQSFRCDNGQTVTVKWNADDQVSLQMGERSAQLKRDVSGSGERYTNPKGLNKQPTEWHQKGRQAILAYTGADGKAVEARCQGD